MVTASDHPGMCGRGARLDEIAKISGLAD